MCAAHHEARHDPLAALRLHNYRVFGAGFLIGSTGLQIMNYLVMWEVWLRTSDALMVGLTGLCRALPVVVLALYAGHVADMRSRKWIVVLTQFAFGMVSLGFAMLSYWHAPIAWYFVLLVASACVRAFNGPARGSLLPELVPNSIFQNVVTYQSGIFQAAAIMGPLIGGALAGSWGPHDKLWMIYVIAAAGCLTFSAAVACTKPKQTPRARRGPTVAAMLEGFWHMWKERPVFGAILLDLLAVLFGGATAMFPIYATEILHSGQYQAEVAGALRAAPYVGALAMAVWLMFRPNFKRAGPVLLWSVAAYAVTIIVFGVSTNLWLSLAALAVGGAVDNISVVIRHVLVQMRTPDHLRGRVGAVNSMFIECSNELGQFESGAVADVVPSIARGLGYAVGSTFGPVAAVVSGGVGTLVVVGMVAWKLPSLRKLGRVKPISEPDLEPV